jgi:hypothetical protein
VAVEFALIAPLVILLFIGIMELSFLMKDYVALSSSVRGGARTASAAADAGPGDCLAETTAGFPCVGANVPKAAQAAAGMMQLSGSAIPNYDIDWVIIYQAGDNGMPLGQDSLTCGSNCVKFVWEPDLGKFRYHSGTWRSSTINACLNDADRMSVGVGMQVTHSWLTGMGSAVFGGLKEMREHTVFQFEPLEADRCKPGTPNAHA